MAPTASAVLTQVPPRPDLLHPGEGGDGGEIRKGSEGEKYGRKPKGKEARRGEEREEGLGEEREEKQWEREEKRGEEREEGQG